MLTHNTDIWKCNELRSTAELRYGGTRPLQLQRISCAMKHHLFGVSPPPLGVPSSGLPCTGMVECAAVSAATALLVVNIPATMRTARAIAFLEITGGDRDGSVGGNTRERNTFAVWWRRLTLRCRGDHGVAWLVWDAVGRSVSRQVCGWWWWEGGTQNTGVRDGVGVECVERERVAVKRREQPVWRRFEKHWLFLL